MDINISPVSGAAQFYTPPAKTVTTDPASAPPVPDPQAPAAQVQFTDVTASNVSATTGSDASAATTTDNAAQQEAAVRQAVLSFKNTYAVSDKEFSIFKDATGKYITRYVSLRDGSVTYVPKPVYLRPTQDGGGSPSVQVAINA